MRPMIKTGVVVTGTCMLLVSAGCGPASTDPVVGFVGDFIRSLVAALLL